MKLKLIVFEGVDKVGKTTIHKLFDKETNYKHLTCDRLFLSYLAYCFRYKREVSKSIKTWLLNNIDNIIIVYLHADKQDLETRYKIAKHEKVNIAKDLKCFEKAIDYINDCNVKYISVNTSLMTEEATVQHIKEALKNEI